MNLNDVFRNFMTVFSNNKAVIDLSFQVINGEHQFKSVNIREVEDSSFYTPYVEVLPAEQLVFIRGITADSLKNEDVKNLLLLPNNFSI